MVEGVKVTEIERMRVVHLALVKGNCGKQSLAHKIGKGAKTVQRLLKRMEENLGAKIAYHPIKKTYYYAKPPVKVPAQLEGIRIGEDQRTNIAIGIKALEFLSLEYNASELRSWVTEVSGDSLDLPMEELDQIFSLAEVRRANVFKKDIREILVAIRHRQRLTFRYKTDYTGKVSQRKIDPYHLTYREAAWYLIGYDHLRQDLRTFALGRMASLKILEEETFEHPPFDPGRHFHDAGIIQNGEPEDVHLVFRGKSVSRIQERDYHFHHKNKRKPYRIDGHGKLHLEFEHSFIEALVPMILSFGKDVEIRKPERLKHLIRAELEEALRNV